MFDRDFGLWYGHAMEQNGGANLVRGLVLVLIVGVIGVFIWVYTTQDLDTTVQPTPTVVPTTVENQVSTPTEAIPPEYMDVSPQAAYDLIQTNPDLIVIDVSPHYDEGHLPGAVHYYLGDGSLDTAIPNLDPSATYLVYCHVDSVAITGAQKLIDAGFTTVYRLEGNYPGWVAAGYPVEAE